jgi:hypothetical protein
VPASLHYNPRVRFPAWVFREMERGEINVDPVHDEFFKAQDLADALVRESIQNSLDARRGRAAVRVRFRFSRGTHALPADRAAQYFEKFDEHLGAAMPDLVSALPGDAAAMPFLVIEDSGTRGLTGDPAGDPDLDAEGSRNDFYYFWRNVGRTSKGELDRGRWGLGKAVFAVSSRIRTIFGLTHRADDARRLLLGQSVLKTHVLNATKFDPYGFFAHVDRHLPLPIEQPALIDAFSRDFGVERSEPGLSIVVPWYREDDLSLEKIARSVLSQYFYPIVRGDLVVVIEDDTVAETITGRTIDEVSARMLGSEAEGLRKLCELTRWSIVAGADSYFTLRLPGPGQPKWSESLLPAQDVELLRDQFDSGERLALRVPISVKRKRGRVVSSHFDVFLQKDDTLRRAEQHFIRRGITISDVRVPNDKPVRALAVIDDEALSTLLGDSENPAHSDWMERADKVKLYDVGPTTVRFVRQSIAQLSSMLSRPPAGRMRDFLADLFSIEGDDATSGAGESGSGDEGGQESGDDASSEMPKIPPRRGPRVTSTRDGFVIRGHAEADAIGLPLRAEMAYRCRNGNPFRKYSAFDFEVGKSVKIDARGAEVQTARENAIEFRPSMETYEIELTGFDSRRDVVVRVVELETDAAEAELH